jgi:hypothetical protein
VLSSAIVADRLPLESAALKSMALESKAPGAGPGLSFGAQMVFRAQRLQMMIDNFSDIEPIQARV